MRMNEKGFSLVELLIAIAIFALIRTATTGLLSAALQRHDYGNARSDLYQEGMMIMERLRKEV